MNRFQVFLSGLVAAVVSGALCALACLGVYFLTDVLAGNTPLSDAVWVLAVWVLFGAWLGMAAGVWLGIVPVALMVVLWPRLEARFGMSGSAAAVGLVVAVIAGIEVLGSVSALDLASGAEAAGWAIGAAAVTGLVAGLLLWVNAVRATQRDQLRRTLAAA